MKKIYIHPRLTLHQLAMTSLICTSTETSAISIEEQDNGAALVREFGLNDMDNFLGEEQIRY